MVGRDDGVIYVKGLLYQAIRLSPRLVAQPTTKLVSGYQVRPRKMVVGYAESEIRILVDAKNWQANKITKVPEG
jgi:hypothetical protein